MIGHQFDDYQSRVKITNQMNTVVVVGTRLLLATPQVPQWSIKWMPTLPCSVSTSQGIELK
jgi:hypothetical protein